MQNEALKAQLASALQADVIFSGEGCHLSATIVSDEFIGLNSVKRQQRVYQILAEAIESGEIHAIQMQTYTRQEWAEQNG